MRLFLLKYFVGNIDIYIALGYILFTRTLKGRMLYISKASAEMRTSVGELRVMSLVVLSVAPSVLCSAFLRTGVKEWKQGRAQNIFTSFLTFGTTFFCNINATFCTMCLRILYIL